MLSTCYSKFTHKPIDEVRKTLIGTRITDIEPDGRAIYLEDGEGNSYCIDYTGDKPVASAFPTDGEKLEIVEDILSALLEKLNISEEELIDILNEKY